MGWNKLTNTMASQIFLIGNIKIHNTDLGIRPVVVLSFLSPIVFLQNTSAWVTQGENIIVAIVNSLYINTKSLCKFFPKQQVQIHENLWDSIPPLLLQAWRLRKFIVLYTLLIVNSRTLLFNRTTFVSVHNGREGEISLVENTVNA